MFTSLLRRLYCAEQRFIGTAAWIRQSESLEGSLQKNQTSNDAHAVKDSTVEASLPVKQLPNSSVELKNKEIIPPGYRFIYPEFLPDPKLEWRNQIREKLERRDMLKRRTQIDIPEFYVGSYMSVTSSTPEAPSKNTKFVGICIHRSECGLRTRFVLRNIIDGLGVEVSYNLYDPKIQKIEVLRLEKRLDDELYYLRDAPPEYSTVPLDMEPEILPAGAPVPVNPIKVPLKPRPWVKRWERTDFKGLDWDHLMTLITEKMKWQMTKHVKPWLKYDLMKQYRSTIPEEEQKEIYSEVYSELHNLEHSKKKMKRKRTFVKPVKSG